MRSRQRIPPRRGSMHPLREVPEEPRSTSRLATISTQQSLVRTPAATNTGRRHHTSVRRMTRTPISPLLPRDRTVALCHSPATFSAEKYPSHSFPRTEVKELTGVSHARTLDRGHSAVILGIGFPGGQPPPRDPTQPSRPDPATPDQRTDRSRPCGASEVQRSNRRVRCDVHGSTRTSDEGRPATDLRR